MKQKYSKKQYIFRIILLCALLLLTITILIYDLYSKVKRGWQNIDTISAIFFGLIIICSIVLIHYIDKYIVESNADIICINNDIYRMFDKLEKEGKLLQYEKRMHQKSK